MLPEGALAVAHGVLVAELHEAGELPAQGVAPLLGAAGQALRLGDHHVHVHPLRRAHRPIGERKTWQGEARERRVGRVR